MKDTQYAFCVARIRALENKLLSKQDILTLINQNDYQSAVKYLASKSCIQDETDIDPIIKKLGDELHSILCESVPDKKILSSLYILNDYYNIKVMIKCMVEGKSATGLFHSPTGINIDSFDKNALDLQFSFLKDNYREVALKAFDIALKSENGKFSDAIIDSAAITALTDFYKQKNSGLLGEICAFLADTANIKIALRCIATKQDKDFITEAIGKSAILDSNKLIECTVLGQDKLLNYLSTTKYKKGVEIYLLNASDYEKWCDDSIIDITKSAAYTSFGFAPVVSYYYRKNLEIKSVRMILTAIKSGIDKDIIKERMRNVYA